MYHLAYGYYVSGDRFAKGTMSADFQATNDMQISTHQRTIEMILEEKIEAYKTLYYISDGSRTSWMKSMVDDIEEFIRHGLDRYSDCEVKPLSHLSPGFRSNPDDVGMNTTCEFRVYDARRMSGGHVWKMKAKTWYPDTNLSFRLVNSRYTIKTEELKVFFESLIARLKLELL